MSGGVERGGGDWARMSMVDDGSERSSEIDSVGFAKSLDTIMSVGGHLGPLKRTLESHDYTATIKAPI